MKYSSRRVLLAVGLGTALSLIGDASLYTVLSTHTAVVGVLLSDVGILLSANRIVRLGSNGVAGWVCDRRSKRWVFVTSLFLGTLSTTVYAFTTGYWPLLLGRILWGISWSGIWVAGNGIVLEIAPEAERGQWIGRYHVSFFLGAASGAFLGGFLTDWLGYHMAMGVEAGLMLMGAAVTLVLLPALPESPLADVKASVVETAAPAPVRWPEIVSATAVLGVNRVVIAGILVPTFGIYLFNLVGEEFEFMARTIGIATLTGLGLGTTTVLSMLFTPAMGALSDRAGSRWQVISGALVPGIAGFGLLAFGLPGVIILGLPLTSLASSSNQGLSTALIGDLSRNVQRGRWLGILYTIGDLGSAIGPPLAFALITNRGWPVQNLYWLSAGLYGCLFLLTTSWILIGAFASNHHRNGAQQDA